MCVSSKMPTATTSSLPIDRDSVEQLKEKLLGLEIEDENNEYSESEVDEEINDTNEGDSTFQDVAILLNGMGMKKYIKTFKKENIDLSTFLSLTKNDLKQLGITDQKDRNTIINNIGAQKETSSKFIVNENHTDDYQIIKNIQNHMTLMQNYCCYVECQMKKNKLFDYDVTSKETALTFFREFTKAAIKQNELISQIVFQEDSSDHLIGKLLEANELVLPEELMEKLVARKTIRRKIPIHLVGLVGLSVVLVFAAKKLVEKVIN